ncbi:MAG TPA: PqqD family protein, partial [Actinomycetota bacterium]|nr:PqqD family protein [Actinomycetota bacterium]
EVLDGEAVILKVDGGIYYKLNTSGTVIWESFRQGADETEAASKLASKYGLSGETAATSVAKLVERLSEIGLLVVT